MGRTRVLVTGAAGNVARLLLPGLDQTYDLRLTDRVATVGGDGNAEVVLGDITDKAFVAGVVDGVDAIVHLAGNADFTAEWDALRALNVEAVVTLLDAAKEQHVRRVVLASSIHAMGRYDILGRTPIDPAWLAGPCCQYGATKAWTEAISTAYVHQDAFAAICLRLGGVGTAPSPHTVTNWLGTDDLRQLVCCAIDSDIAFGTYHGVSANTRGHWRYENATLEIGYSPTQNSETYVSDMSWVAETDTGLCRPREQVSAGRCD